MAEFNRSLSAPLEARARARGHTTACPRCRVDPGHASRQLWEDPGHTDPRQGYPPDLCRRPGRAGAPQQQYHTQQQQRPGGAGYNYSGGAVRYSSDNHSTRSAGDTWRIRGILENHPPDVTRRAESSLGRLPDVTHHAHQAVVQHARTRSVPVGGTYDSRAPPSTTSHEILLQNHHQQAVSRSSTHSALSQRLHQDTSGSLSATTSCSGVNRIQGTHTLPHRPPPDQWKREQPSPSVSTAAASSPWMTTSRQLGRTADRQPFGGSNNSNSAWPSQQQQQQQQPQQHQQSSSCWRPSAVSPPAQNVLTACPLPDLVTPRRQARKQCCGLLATHSVAIRWLVVVIAALGLLCSIVGTIVGVVKSTGREHLTVALLLIGLGIVLVSMSGVAWRLTARDSPSCRAMFGFGRARHEQHRRFVPRVPHYGRPHPFSAMLYPDITLRPPPPSYQASMQEYRLRLLLMDRQSSPHPATPPPPMYRGPATVYSRFPMNSEYSRPPSYRSRPSSAGQPSPLGPEDSDPPPPPINSHTASDVMPSPPAGQGTNHVEVVAQV